MIKILEIETKVEHTFDRVKDAADFLGMKKSSLYNKFKNQSNTRGYIITHLDFKHQPKPKDKDRFKRFKEGKFLVEFYKNTANITWKRKVSSDYDEKLSIKGQKEAILATLRQNPIWDTKYILLHEISPASYTNLPPKEESFDLYVNFKDILDYRNKKDAVIQHLLPYL